MLNNKQSFLGNGMKRYIALLALVACAQTFAMNENKSGCGCAKVATDALVAQRFVTKLKCMYQDTRDSSAYGAKIEQSNSVHHVTRIPRPSGLWAHIMNRESKKIHYEIRDVVPDNITLWEDASGAYDVIYRGEDGVVVAKNLETGEELYHLACGRKKGDAHETLSQSQDGWVMVMNSDGSHKIWSHPDMKNRAIVNQSCCRGSRGKSD